MENPLTSSFGGPGKSNVISEWDWIIISYTNKGIERTQQT